MSYIFVVKIVNGESVKYFVGKKTSPLRSSIFREFRFLLKNSWISDALGGKNGSIQLDYFGSEYIPNASFEQMLSNYKSISTAETIRWVDYDTSFSFPEPSSSSQQEAKTDESTPVEKPKKEKKQKKEKKESDAPKRPPRPYDIYMVREIPKQRKEFPDLTAKQVFDKVTSEWKTHPDNPRNQKAQSQSTESQTQSTETQ